MSKQNVFMLAVTFLLVTYPNGGLLQKKFTNRQLRDRANKLADVSKPFDL